MAAISTLESLPLLRPEPLPPHQSRILAIFASNMKPSSEPLPLHPLFPISEEDALGLDLAFTEELPSKGVPLADVQKLLKDIFFHSAQALLTTAALERLDKLEAKTMGMLHKIKKPLVPGFCIRDILKLFVPVFVKFTEEELFEIQDKLHKLPVIKSLKSFKDLALYGRIFQELLQKDVLKKKDVSKSQALAIITALQTMIDEKEYENFIKLAPLVDSDDMFYIFDHATSYYLSDSKRYEEIKKSAAKIGHVLQQRYGLDDYNTEIQGWLATK